MTALEADAPWWGVPLVAGIFAFVGVVLAQGVGLYNGRRAERVADQRRWHDERRRSYADFLRAIRQLEFNASAPHYIERELHAKLLEQCEQAYNEIELLGASRTVQLVADLYADAIEVWAQITMVNEEVAGAGQEVDRELRDSLKKDRLALLAEIRSELGIVPAPKGGTVLNATKPYEILREAFKVAFNVQAETSQGLVNGIRVGVVIIVKDVAAMVASVSALIASMLGRTIRRK